MTTLPNLSVQLSAKLAALADRFVRHLIATFPRVSRCPHCFKDLEPPRNHFYGDDKITALRVLAGVFGHRAAQYGVEETYVSKTSLPSGYALPKATTVEDPGYPEDATTQPYRPGHDPLRPRTPLPLPPLPRMPPPPDVDD